MKSWPGTRQPLAAQVFVRDGEHVAEHVPSRHEGEVVSAHPEARLVFQPRDRQALRQSLEGFTTVIDVPPSVQRHIALPTAPENATALSRMAAADAARTLHKRLQAVERSGVAKDGWQFPSQAAVFTGVEERAGSLASAVAALERSLTPIDGAGRNELLRRCTAAGDVVRQTPPRETIAEAREATSVLTACKDAAASFDRALRVKRRCDSLQPVMSSAMANLCAVDGALDAHSTFTSVRDGLRQRTDELEASMTHNESALKRAVDGLVLRLADLKEKEVTLHR